MSEDKINIELNKALLNDMFVAAGLTMPEFVTEKEFKSALAILKSKSNESAPIQTSQPIQSGEIVYQTAAEPADIVNPDPKFVTTNKQLQKTMANSQIISRPRSVLIVDDLGIIIYQLNLLFKRLKFEVVVSQDINDAIDKFKAKDFGYAILDLYIPTDREGFYLLDEIKKISLLCKLNTKIIVMSATSREAFKVKAVQHGADRFIEKAQGWQKEIVEACLERTPGSK